MEEEKFVYKTTFISLRSLKTEIEHMQHLLEKLKVKLMKDFELWWTVQLANSQPQVSSAVSPTVGASQKVPSAWKTPSASSMTYAHSGGQLSQRASSPDSLSSLNSDVDTGGSISKQARQLTRPAMGGLALTGDSKVDADIEAFVRARQNILRKVNASQR
uniref:Kinesin-like protein KIF6/9 C-terminal domain-containing protein n=1 Tax=Arion vulgaris TaxID=1028688 RepID=A0A0B6YS43_9EUPU